MVVLCNNREMGRLRLDTDKVNVENKVLSDEENELSINNKRNRQPMFFAMGVTLVH